MADTQLPEGLGLRRNDPQNLDTLEIHKLSQAQYDTLLANNLINENAIYMTPNEAIDTSVLATQEQVDAKADKEHTHSFDDIERKTEDNSTETLTTVLDAMNEVIGKKVNAVADKGLSTNDLTKELKEAYDGAVTHAALPHAPSDAEANVITAITVNNEPITPSNKTVNINVPIDYLVANDIENLAKKATTLAGYEIGDAYTKTEIDAMLASVAHISTDESEDITITDEINQQIIAAVNSALASAKASGQFDGQDGETPVKGEDYWTTTDKNEIIDAVLARIPVGNEVKY